MRRRCRVWWPRESSSSNQSSSTSSRILFGWFFSCSADSLEVVVASACNEGEISTCQLSIEGILCKVNDGMPVFLQNKSMFSILGQCAADLSGSGPLDGIGTEEDIKKKLSNCGNCWQQNGGDTFRGKRGRWTCGCYKLGGMLEEYRQASIGSKYWIQLVYHSSKQRGRGIHEIPKFLHIHWNKEIVSRCDVHVVVYDMPTYGAHHLSLSLKNSSGPATPLKIPKWVSSLQQKLPPIDLVETVILAINCSAFAEMFIERHVSKKRSFGQFSAVSMFHVFSWNIISMSIASVSSLFYIVLQFLHGFWSYNSRKWICISLAEVFRMTWINIRIRSCQILYWPILLQDYGLRSRSCVEYAEKAALRKHSMWSSLAVDVLLGNLFGWSLLYKAESACLWLINFANDNTNTMLRSGCVWLMGNPAGFKLNTELAGVLGLISLNAIQIWSTLWIFLGFLSIYFARGLAVLGIIFGVTVPAALIIDMIALATLHLSALHWWISLLYSMQIQALSALWRLFGGRKLNPLRDRLDSYEYTVKQHIVGSLMFTPLLLLLPTTSVFYMFFSIMNTSVNLTCILIEVAISFIHTIPYIKLFLWLVRPRRFPSGIWFEILSCWSHSPDIPEVVCCGEIGSPSENSHPIQDITGKKSTVLLSFLHTNSSSIGDIISPHYRDVFSGVSRSFIATSAHGVLTGSRIPSTLGTGLPSRMPWMSIPCKAYWYLCRNAILACSSRQ